MPTELISRASAFAEKAAVVDSEGRHTYQHLLDESARIAAALLGARSDLGEDRIAFLFRPGFRYVATQWGIWRAGGIAVPLAVMHPPAEIEYVLDDTDANALVVDSRFSRTLQDLAAARSIPCHVDTEWNQTSTTRLPEIAASRRAMILYTSGTTSRPKGVVTTHSNIAAQIEALVSAWAWSSEDRILNVLPLHHVHGIINVLSCALWTGACCEFLTPFDAEQVWNRFSARDLTLFMAVPTIYSRLINAFEAADASRQQSWAAGAGAMRLMVSGSAALPVSVLERWHAITNHVLLERYGMTEIGMALSNPLDGQRRPGHVGTPLPNIEVRRVDETGEVVSPETAAEIEVRGPTVFREYWRSPDATRDAFRDGWFRTGDVAVVDEGAFRILGRSSVDIIKTGGYKVSALEIEEVLRMHGSISECAVVGVPDEEWGEQVAACIVAAGSDFPTLDELRQWARERLAPYKIPKLLELVADLPRNAMGKVQKPAIVKLFEGE